MHEALPRSRSPVGVNPGLTALTFILLICATFCPAVADKACETRLFGKIYEVHYILPSTCVYPRLNAMIEAVIHHNKFNEKPALLNKGMIADNILPNPIHIWNWGLQNASGSVEIFDIDAVRLHLLGAGQASVREDGIHFKSMRYTTSRAIAEGWFSRARTKGASKIDVRYDNTTTNHIWYFDKDAAKMERCDLMDSEARYHNM